jgi:hypothetical protein
MPDHNMMTDDEFSELEEHWMIPIEPPPCPWPHSCGVCGRERIDLDVWTLALPPEPGVPPGYLILRYELCEECAKKPGALESLQADVLQRHHLIREQVRWSKMQPAAW